MHCSDKTAFAEPSTTLCAERWQRSGGLQCPAHETSFRGASKTGLTLPHSRYLVLFNKVTAAVYDNLTHVVSGNYHIVSKSSFAYNLVAQFSFLV